MLAIKANIPTSVQHMVLLWASPSSHLSHPATSNSPKKTPSAPAGLGQMHHPGHADAPNKTPTLTHFILSQQCKSRRSNVATSPTLSQPDSDKFLPVTCNLPGIQLRALQRMGPVFVHYGDGTFHLFIYFSSLSSMSKHPWVVISSVLLFQKCKEKPEHGG